MPFNSDQYRTGHVIEDFEVGMLARSEINDGFTGRITMISTDRYAASRGGGWVTIEDDKGEEVGSWACFTTPLVNTVSQIIRNHTGGA